MKRLFTLAIIAMIASLTFAQAPVQKMKASEKKIEKVMSAAQLQKGMDAKSIQQAKAEAAKEQSTSVLRRAAKPSVKAGKVQKAVMGAEGARPALKNKQGAVVAKPKARTISAVKPNLPVLSAEGLVLNKSLKAKSQAKFVSKPKAAAPAALLPAYKGNGYIYDFDVEQFGLTDEWDVTPDADEYGDLIYDVLPPTLFDDPLPFYYAVEDGKIVCYPEPLAWADQAQTMCVFAMDTDDYRAGGTGAIVLELAADGTLSVPADRANHIYGYVACTINENYEPIDMLGYFDAYAGLEYTAAGAGEPVKDPDAIEVAVIQPQLTWYDDDNDWFVVMQNPNFQFRFDVVGETKAGGLQLNKLYTLDDMIADYSWGKNQLTGEGIIYASAELYLKEGANGVDYIAAVEDTNGNKYYITYTTIKYPDIVDYQTVTFSEGETDYINMAADAGVIQLIGWSAETGMEAYIAFKTNKFTGHYTTEDLYAEATKLYLDANDFEGVDPFYVEADVTKTGATVVYRAYNGVEYTLNFTYEMPEPVITDLTAELPYSNGFDTAAEQAEAAIYDSNEDGKTFTFYEDATTSSMIARYTYDSANTADDYVVFPGLALEAGKSYKVSVDARSYSDYYPETVEVVVGTEAKASKLSTVVIPATVPGSKYETLTADFAPEADGVYYFAIHAISEPDMYYLYTDNFAVKENNPNAPLPVANIAAEADQMARLKASISYDVPAQTVGGAELEDDVTIEVYRGGELIKTYEVEPGTHSKFTDNEIETLGTYNYSVVAVYNGIASEPAKVSVYVGEVLPLDVENLAAADKNDHVALTWDPVTMGQDGGPFIPSNVEYNVYPVEMVEFFGMLFPEIDYENPYATGVKETNYDVEYNTNEGEQGFTYFGVTTQNNAGETYGAMTAALLGAPYEIPFHEGLTGQALHYWWGTACDEANSALEGGLYLAPESSDGDGVGFGFVAETAGWIDMQSGKIALNGAENAGLTFDYMSDAASTLSVNIITPAGEETIETIAVPASQEFQTAKISLANYSDEPWVRFVLHGEFNEATMLVVDNVNVMDFISDNLTISVSAPKSVVAGQAAVVKAVVKNEGENAAKDYTVKFYINDNEAATPLFEAPELGFLESAEFEFELETSIFDEAGDVTVKAEVVYEADLKEADNADETVIVVTAPSVTPVASVTAEETEAGVVINWTVAESSSQEVTEDFDSYEASTVYATGEACGPWTAVDNSQGSTYSWNSGAWAHMGESYAFGIINMVDEGLDASFATPSGEQAAIFMSEVNETSQLGQAADKYMISPELPGIAQTISFQALPITIQYGPETFEILASSTDMNVSSFSKVASFSSEDEDWTEYSAQLPAGTKYFAIHYTSNDIFGLFIDDLKYTVGGGTPTGFNVYVDQAMVASLKAEDKTYTYAEELSEGAHDFSVTAVYGNAESAPVTVSLGTDGIENVTASKSLEIYTVDGIRINNVKNLKAGVYVVNGKKVVLK